jgi:hypothetical protein
MLDPDSSVDISNRYGLDCKRIELLWARDFPHWPWGPPSQFSFPGVKRPGRGVHQPHASSADVQERADLYLYFPSSPSWNVIG